MVEFAFAASWFFLLIVVTFESAVLGWRALTAQFIASSIARESALFGGEEGVGKANVRAMKDQSYELATRLGLRLAPYGTDPWTPWRNWCILINNAHPICGIIPPPPPAPWHNNVQICPISGIDTTSSSPTFGQCTSKQDTFGDQSEFVIVRVEIPTQYFFQQMTINVIGEAAARNEK